MGRCQTLSAALCVAGMKMRGCFQRPRPQWTLLFIVLGICQSLCIEASSSLRRQRRLSVVQSRVVGGKEAAVGKFPFFGFWYGGDCGATLVNTDMFLTAAHVS